MKTGSKQTPASNYTGSVERVPMEATATDYFAAFTGVRFASLTTFRKNGAAVATPIWFAEHAGTLYVYTGGSSGKVKRIRQNGQVTLAPCTMNGRVTGPAIDAHARLVGDPAEIALAKRLLLRKYWLGRRVLYAVDALTSLFNRKPDNTAYLAISAPMTA